LATLYIIRHGQTDWNVSRIVMGQSDVPLNAVGQAQAEALASAVGSLEVDALYCSPQLRARQTAEPLGKVWGTNVVMEPALAEVDFGEWVGRTYGQLFESQAHATYLDGSIRRGERGMEGLHEVYERSTEFMKRVIQERPDGRFAFVSHGDPIRSLLSCALAVPLSEYRRLRIANAGLSMILREKDRWILTLFNYRPDPDWRAEL
jgi:broad specificity phosphatase PhoE